MTPIPDTCFPHRLRILAAVAEPIPDGPCFAHCGAPID